MSVSTYHGAHQAHERASDLSIEYPTGLVTVFKAAALTSLIAVMGLILAPAYADAKVATLLMFVLAVGLGTLSLVVGIASRLRKRQLHGERVSTGA